MTVEKYLTAKELASALEDQGVNVSVKFVRCLLKAGAPRLGNRAKLSVLMSWWEANPDLRPRVRKNIEAGR